MQPFADYELHKVLDTQIKKLAAQVDKFSNEEIMANDENILADNCFQQFFIDPVAIGEEDLQKRTATQNITGNSCSMTFSFPYNGDYNLFKCRASTYSLSGYPDIKLSEDSITLHYEVPLHMIQTLDQRESFIARMKFDLESIKKGISYANSDVNSFNQSLKKNALGLIQTKKQKIEQFFKVQTLFEIPIIKTPYAKDHIPVQRKIKPIANSYDNSPNYYISDAEYADILMTIKHNGSTFERTPSSLSSLKEEDIRNLLLASLNGTYKGVATGEAFRNKGKTDICIECDNRSAFVAECKIWKGQGNIDEALKQLDGYLTWRDCKTALIYFVRNKNFLCILDAAKQALKTINFVRQMKEIDKNEFACSYISQSNPGQIIQIRVMLFNLYSD